MHRAHVSADPSASRSGSQDTKEGGGGEGGASGGGVARSPLRHLAPLPPTDNSSYRRSSSGYHSVEGDSLPASPRAVAATQTPSPPAQALQHARSRLAEEFVSQANFTVHPHSWLGDEMGAMQAVEFGQHLQRIGDDYNDYILRRGARPAAGVHNWLPLPHFHQDPGFLLCVGLACFVIIWYCGGDPPGRGEPPRG
ncbi:bcl-2-like protein 11 [Stigmatopora argus]